MALPDISHLSTSELAQLSELIGIEYAQSLADRATVDEERRVYIAQAVSALEDLLGSESSPANLTSIRGVLQYSDAQMGANAGLAFRLVFLGMEELTKTTLSIAKLLAK